MTPSQSPIWIVDGSTGQPVEAVLCDRIMEHHLRDFEDRWRPWLEDAVASRPELPRQQSVHWDWRKKTELLGGLLAFPSFAVECAGETQGLMIVNTTEFCRLDCQRGKPVVYVEFLETAPWNRQTLTSRPRYRRVGPALIDVAIQVSLNEGFQGRVGLHSLLQSDGWYRDKCGMADLGADPKKQGLRYFEMTIEQARVFLGEGK